MKKSEQAKKKLEIMRRPWRHPHLPYRTLDIDGEDYYYLYRPIANRKEGRWLIDDKDDTPGIVCIRVGRLPADYWPGWYRSWTRSLQTFEDYQKLIKHDEDN